MFDITVIGMGHVGTVLAIICAEKNYSVCGVDKCINKLNSLRNGIPTFHEPGLDIRLPEVINRKTLNVSDSIHESGIFVIALPTPLDKSNEHADMSIINCVIHELAHLLHPGNLIIVESTIPPDSTIHISEYLKSIRPDLTFPHEDQENPDIYIAYCPERISPGNALYEMMYTPRIIGGVSIKCTEEACMFYMSVLECTLSKTSAKLAEIAKITENAFRDVNIAFSNEIASICNHINIDPCELISNCNTHPRVNMLSHGIGVGGHCLPVDPYFLTCKFQSSTNLIQTARTINNTRPLQIAKRINNDIITQDNMHIVVLGLAYKANTCDTRNSPAITVVQELAKNHRIKTLTVIDPYISKTPPELQVPTINFDSIDKSIYSADAVIILVNHNEFKNTINNIPSSICIVRAYNNF